MDAIRSLVVQADRLRAAAFVGPGCTSLARRLLRLQGDVLKRAAATLDDAPLVREAEAPSHVGSPREPDVLPQRPLGAVSDDVVASMAAAAVATPADPRAL